jgi:hypothetical protein
MNLILSVLFLVTQKLSEANIKYGIGGSLLLYSYGLVSTCHDIDLLFIDEDYEKVKSLFALYIYHEKKEQHPLYKTSHMLKLKINGIDIDMMFDFKITFDKYSFVYQFQTNKRFIEGALLDFSFLEDWYLIYQLIPGRKEKVKWIEDYYLTSKKIDINRFQLLGKSIIPDEIRSRMSSLLAAVDEPDFDF